MGVLSSRTGGREKGVKASVYFRLRTYSTFESEVQICVIMTFEGMDDMQVRCTAACVVLQRPPNKMCA